MYSVDPATGVWTFPDGEITTCDDLRLEVECCESCHGYYLHYDMYVVEQPDGQTAWICCAVRRVLFPETAIANDDPVRLELMRIPGGDGAGGHLSRNSSEQFLLQRPRDLLG
jgi:hypothetical protein